VGALLLGAGGAGWHWLALVGTGWHWLALVGTGWHWLALVFKANFGFYAVFGIPVTMRIHGD